MPLKMTAAKQQKIGLFFGSFNPIHVGHLIIANHMVEYGDLDMVWFIISPHNPFKEKVSLLDDNHRFYMVQLAVEDNPKLRASNIEFTLPQPSFTIDTLTVIVEKFPGKEFALIMGADNLISFNKWKNYEQIIENHKVYVYNRPDCNIDEWKGKPNVKIFDAPLMQISSSFIRNSIMDGKSVEYLLVPKVYEYLNEMHFYQINKSKT